MRPNKGMNRSAEQRRFARCSVPVPLRPPAPGYARRWAALCPAALTCARGAAAREPLKGCRIGG